MNRTEILNSEKAFLITGGSKDLFCQIMNLFIDLSPSQLERVKIAYRRGDMDELSASAHDIKSSASSFGGDVLSKSSGKLEQSAKMKDDLEIIYSMIIEVEKDIQSIIKSFYDRSWTSDFIGSL